MRTSFYVRRVMVASVVFVAGTASAGFTKVDGPTGSEPTQAEILSTIYGGTFAGNGDTYSNGDITARRLSDFDDSSTDQSWKAGKYTVRSLAKFTSEASSFFASNPTKPEVHASNLGVEQGDPVIIRTRGSFSWTATNYYGTSNTDVSLNTDGKDHFVTYEIQDNASSSGTKFVLFWEDLPQTRNVQKSEASWSDFNDLVVEVQAAAPSGAVIPLPPAAYAGGATMALFTVGNYLRNRFRRA